MTDIEFWLERDGVEAIHLNSDAEGPYRLDQDGTSGLGAPPVAAQYFSGTGAGSTYIGERDEAAPINLAVWFHGDDRLTTGELIAAMYRLLKSRPGIPAARLVARYANGDVYEREVRYEGGLELDSSGAKRKQHLAVLQLTAPGAFWVARDPVTFTIRAETSAPAFLSSLASLPVGSSRAFGTVSVANPGDVPAFVDWRVVGPSTQVQVSRDGVGFTLEGDLTADELRLIDGRRAAIVDGTGASKYTEFGPAPKMPSADPGMNEFTIDMIGAEPGEWVDSDAVLYENRLIEPGLRTTHAKWGAWSDGNGTTTFPSTGFPVQAGVAAAGYVQVGFASTVPADTAIWFDVDVLPGLVASPQMSVRCSKTQWVQGALWLFDSSNTVVAMVARDPQQAVAGVPIVVGIPGSVIGPLPVGVARARFVVSTFRSLCTNWVNGDTFRGSLGAFMTAETLLPYFDGGSDHSDWAGTPNASVSEMFAQELVGASEVTGLMRPRKALVY